MSFSSHIIQGFFQQIAKIQKLSIIEFFLNRFDPQVEEIQVCPPNAIDIGYGGSFSTYHVKLENGRQLTAIRANRERTAEHHLTWGDEVYLHWSPDSAVVLLS